MHDCQKTNMRAINLAACIALALLVLAPAVLSERGGHLVTNTACSAMTQL